MSTREDRWMPIATAAKVMPGGPIPAQTVSAWGRAGIHGIVLETMRVGSRRFTTLKAIEEFNAKVDASMKALPGPKAMAAAKAKSAAKVRG